MKNPFVFAVAVLFFSFSFLEVEILVILRDLKSYLLWKS